MKIAITSQGQDLDSRLDERFGRCHYFIMIDTDSDGFEVIKNEGMAASGGAGISTAQLIANHGVDILITGHVGPNAIRVLQSSGIKVYSVSADTVKNALDQFTDNQLELLSNATVGPHFGIGRK